ITSPNNPSTTVTGMIPGTYLFAWQISNGSCAVSSDTMQIIMAGVPSPSNAGPDQSLCDDTSVTLAGNTPVVGTGFWNFISGPPGAVIATPSSPSTIVTGLTTGTYFYQW